MIILKQANEARIWISDAGYFVVNQVDETGKENYIVLSLEQANRIALYITDNNDELSQLWNDGQGVPS